MINHLKLNFCYFFFKKISLNDIILDGPKLK